MQNLITKSIAACIFFISWAAPHAWAAPSLDAVRSITFNEYVAEKGVDRDLKRVLKENYAAFVENFENSAHPVPLKDGGIFFDGWRLDSPEKHAAAFVQYPDGRLYAAFFNIEDGRIFYFGHKNAKIHPAIQIWAKRFSPPFELISQDESPWYIAPQKSATAAPSSSEQDELRKVAASVWNQSLANGWDMKPM